VSGSYCIQKIKTRKNICEFLCEK